jgi:hypothetical protein
MSSKTSLSAADLLQVNTLAYERATTTRQRPFPQITHPNASNPTWHEKNILAGNLAIRSKYVQPPQFFAEPKEANPVLLGLARITFSILVSAMIALALLVIPISNGFESHSLVSLPHNPFSEITNALAGVR